MGIGYRIKEARENQGLTQMELGKIVGVTGSAITNYENETSHPKESIMYKLIEALKVDANYLFQDCVKLPKEINDITLAEYDHIKKYRDLDLHGQETVSYILDRECSRIKKYGKLGEQGTITLIEVSPTTDISKVIPYWKEGAAAGSGIYQLNDTESVPMKLFVTSVTRQADFIIKVSGESMSPDYHDGDKVLVSQKAVVQLGEVGIFVKNGSSYIKEMGTMELISRNPDYPNIPVNDFDNVVCLGKVIGKVTDDMIVHD